MLYAEQSFYAFFADDFNAYCAFGVHVCLHKSPIKTAVQALQARQQAKATKVINVADIALIFIRMPKIVIVKSAVRLSVDTTFLVTSSKEGVK